MTMHQNNQTRVRVGLKFVRNLGNYESIHIDLGVEDFVREDDGNVDRAVDRVYKFVESKLLEKVREVEEELK